MIVGNHQTGLATNASGAEPESPPLSAQDSLATIHVQEGYEIQLVASEPLVKDPVAIAWDAEGRLWVAEMADYPLGIDGDGKPGGRIRILEDTDDDGQYDHSRVFTDGLPYPTGVLPWKNGVLITAAPNILYAADTNGDGTADKIETLFAGFHEGNQQLRVNGLRRGLDNWVYCASGSHTSNYGAGSQIQSRLTGELVPVGSRDFRFQPATGELDPQSGPAQFGRNRDDWGNWFGSMNSHPLWHYVLNDRYTRRNPYAAPPDPRKQLILPRNPKVYPAKAPQQRFHSFQQSGRFTSACSAMIYRDQVLFPGPKSPDRQSSGVADQHAFTCEPFHNLVQHFVVRKDGVTFTAERSPTNAKVDFFASKDRWCRPVMARTGPDGALYVVDMYRYMIEHPHWLTPEGREELKPFYRHGDDRGRIYRIVRKREGRTTQETQRITNLRSLSLKALVQRLESSNGPQRDLVQEMLINRADPASNPLLIDLLRNSASPLARLHALCTLDGLGKVTPEALLLALGDKHPGVQQHAIRIAEPVAASHPAVLKAAIDLTGSPSAKVRLQLACSLGEWPSKKSGDALASLMLQSQSDVYLAAAAMSSVSEHNIAIVIDAVLRDNASIHLVTRLLKQAVAMEQTSAANETLRFVIDPKNGQSNGKTFNILASLFQGLKASKITARDFLRQADSTGAVAKRVEDLIDIARAAVADPVAVEPLRIAAIPVLAPFPDQRLDDLQRLSEMLTPLSSPAIQSAAIRHMASFPNAEVPELFLGNWSSHSPAIRAQVLNSLLSRPDWLSTLLRQLETGTISVSEIDAVTRQKLAMNKAPKIQARVKAILNTAGADDRNDVVAKFRDSLSLTGDPSRGKAIFKKTCASCHKLENVGFDIGPNLASLTDRRAETLLTSILNPSAAVDSKYVTYTVLTDDGRLFSGILGAETGNSITLVMQENKKQVILRNQIEEIQSTGKSMMPDGLEKDTTSQDIADLLSYLSGDQLQ